MLLSQDCSGLEANLGSFGFHLFTLSQKQRLRPSATAHLKRYNNVIRMFGLVSGVTWFGIAKTARMKKAARKSYFQVNS